MDTIFWIFIGVYAVAGVVMTLGLFAGLAVTEDNDGRDEE